VASASATSWPADPGLFYVLFSCQSQPASSFSDAPPSRALRSALGVLRRPATPADVLPRALVAKLTSGPLVEGANPGYARLLSASPVGRTFIVPAQNVRYRRSRRSA
jgi:hypothetical protein